VDRAVWRIHVFTLAYRRDLPDTLAYQRNCDSIPFLLDCCLEFSNHMPRPIAQTLLYYMPTRLGSVQIRGLSWMDKCGDMHHA
jgi:hypothetical protein